MADDLTDEERRRLLINTLTVEIEASRFPPRRSRLVSE
jgi:hypothetical protein